MIRRRLRYLSENCGSVLVLASVLGREFDLAALERVSEVKGDGQFTLYATGSAGTFDIRVDDGVVALLLDAGK